MPKGIARQAIGSRAGLGRRQIAGRFGQADVGYTLNFPPGAYSFSPTKAGFWKFVLWGAGGSSSGGLDSGASAGYCEITRFLTPASVVALVVPTGPFGGAAGTAATATFPDGKVVSAGGGGLGAGGAGVATGGDVNLNGTDGVLNVSGSPGGAGLGTGGGAGGFANGGSGAPANLPYRGGGSPNLNTGTAPGAGSGQAVSSIGGDGLILVAFVRD